MAAGFVPPPPEDNLDFISQQNYSSQRHDVNLYEFGGDGFAGLNPHHHHSRAYPEPPVPTINNSSARTFEKGRPQGFVQRVPETPSLKQRYQQTPSSECQLDFSFDGASGREHIGLRPISVVPEQYHGIFKNFSHFNFVQSKVFDDVMYTDSSLVVSAPTGSGKTVIFELAIIRLLMQSSIDMITGKIIYVAPIKALCSQRFEDWNIRFGSLGLNCCELTGDSQLDDYFELQNAQIVMTTPEKWDSMTRKWRDYKSLVHLVRLFLIDEVHHLNDETRGPTMEAIVSRMKTIQASMLWEDGGARNKLRFIAVSATAPNISDIAAWLGSSEESPALEFSIDESHRPVRLRRVVLGYPDASTHFKFNLALNYRLGGVIQLYSDQKPTLVFCATRKGTQQAATVLVKEAHFVMNTAHKQRLQQTANTLRDSKLRDLVMYGVGYHHAGMDSSDRKVIETTFTAGDLPVLFATSTLAMGVNLPAHLVVIKSTMHYIAGMFQECSESQVLQMIGRAGRPQFDVTATAVIMTRNSTKAKYEALLSGNQLIESNLHRNLIEHLNAEVVLHTITDVSIALEWLRSTFFYIRVKQNPKYYGMPVEQREMEDKLQQLCLKNIQMLESCSLVKMDDGFTLQHTEMGRLMARYCVAFDSMKRFLSFKGKETLSDLVNELSQCKEFEDVRLRVNEKRVLNTLNKDKNKPTIRFQLPGKIKSTDMKVNCLMQATLGCLSIQEFALNQDVQKIFRAASRLSKCLMEIQMIGGNFQSLLSAVILHKCIQAKLWENSKFVSKQLDKIGLTLSTTLVNAGLTSFQKLQSTSPREIELIMNRHPPFGNQIRDAVTLLPQYKLNLNQVSAPSGDWSELEVTIVLVNHALLKETGSTWGDTHTCVLLVGDADNTVLCKQKIRDSQLFTGGQYIRKVAVQKAKAGAELKVHYISLDRVGVDLQENFAPKYIFSNSRAMKSDNQSQSKTLDSSFATSKPGPTPRSETANGAYYKSCNHKCLNKAVCGHDCCKHGILVKPRAPTKSSKTTQGGTTPIKQNPPQSSSKSGGQMSRYVDQLHARASDLPPTPALKRIKPALSVYRPDGKSKLQTLSDRFSYTPQQSMKYCGSTRTARSDVSSPLQPHSYNTPADSASMKSMTSNHNSSFDDFSFPFHEFEAEQLSNLDDEYDDFAPENFFDDVPMDDESYNLSPVASIYPQKGKNPVGKQCTNIKSVDSGLTKRYYEDRSATAKHTDDKVVEEMLNYQTLEKEIALPLRRRKRLIDEMFDIDGEDCINAGNTKSPRMISETKDYNNRPNLPKISSTIFSIKSDTKRTNETDIKFLKDPVNNYISENRPSMENHSKKLTQNSIVQKQSSLPKLQQLSPKFSTVSRQPAAEHRKKGGDLLRARPEACTPGPIACSFFSSGVEDSPEDQTDYDVFGAVFAGIF